MNFFQVVKKDFYFYRKKFYSDKEAVFTFFAWIKCMFHPAFSLVFLVRLYIYLYSRKSRVVNKVGFFLYLRTSKKYSCDIHPRARIGVPLKLAHPFNIVIGGDVKIGSGCYIFNGVTLGNKNVGSDNSMPVIGDNVIIGTGAKLLGGVKVGDGCIVGANSIVICDLPSDQVWAGIPAKFIKKINVAL